MLTKHTPRTYIRTTRCPVCKKGQIEETTVFNGGITTIIEKTCSNLLCTSHIKKETELEKRFKAVGEQDVKDPIVVAKFFNPVGAGTWFATEYNPETKIFFGYVSIFGDEWGDFSLEELESIKGFGGLGIERDLYTKEQRISEFKIPTLEIKE